MATRATPEEIEDRMTKRLADAIYPILIPVEEQDMAIQARNRAEIEQMAREVWIDFLGGRGRRVPDIP